MATYIVQRYCARNDTNGNPRRVIVVRDETGRIVATEDEGLYGRDAAVRWAIPGDIDAVYKMIDIGDVDVRPGIYDRLVRWQEGDGQ